MCFRSGQKIKGLLDHLEREIPSVAHAVFWTAFHQLRQDEHLKGSWHRFPTDKVPTNHHQDNQLALQLLLDRLLKAVIKTTAEKKETSSSSVQIRPLTAMELEYNAIRYMAGYVTVNLLKKYKKPTRHPELKRK